jgi:hypothetical protein
MANFYYRKGPSSSDKLDKHLEEHLKLSDAHLSERILKDMEESEKKGSRKLERKKSIVINNMEMPVNNANEENI